MERSNFMKDNHDSYIEEINRIKIRIHQSLYNGGPFLDNLLESVHRHLPSMNNISYDNNITFPFFFASSSNSFVNPLLL